MDTSDLPTFSNPPTTLFTLRIWHETTEAEPNAVRMQVKHVLSGETRYFRDWGQLMAYLEGKLREALPPASLIEIM